MACVCAFGAADGSRRAVNVFATVSQDNRVKVWDTATGVMRNEYTQSNHLSTKSTCIAFGADSTAKKSKKSSKQHAESDLGLMAVGSENGIVIIWQMRTGSVLCELKDESSPNTSISDICFTEDGTLLYAASTSKFVRVWNVVTGKLVTTFSGGKHTESTLCLSPNGKQILTGSTSMRLWDITGDTFTITQKYRGHSSLVNCMRFSPDGVSFISAASDRFLMMWAVGPENPLPARTFSVESIPLSITFDMTYAGDGYRFAATDDEGSVHIWHCLADGSDYQGNKKGAKQANGVAACQVAYSGDGEPASVKSSSRVLGAVFVSNGKGDMVAGTNCLLVARGVAHPIFQAVDYLSAKGKYLPAVELASVRSSSLVTDSTGQKRKEAGGRTNVAVGAMGESMAMVQAPLQQTGKKMKVEDEAALRDKYTSLAQRIAALSKESVDTVRQVLVNQHHQKNAPPTSASSISSSSSSQLVPKADSLTTVLSQALHTNDESLLEYCLNVTNRTVINATISRLPAPFIVPLLTSLIHKFQGSPNRGPTLMQWVHQILVSHTAYLLSLKEMGPWIQILLQTIDTRMGVFKKLSQLNGRLELLLSLVNSQQNSAQQQSAGAKQPSGTPLTQYNEEEEEGSEIGSGEEDEEDDDDEGEGENDDDEDDFDSDEMAEFMD